MLVIVVFFMSYYAQINFTLEAISALFEIKSNDNSRKWEEKELYVSFYDKLKLIVNCRPDEKLKKLVDRGTEKLNVKFDLMYQMKMIHHNHKK